MSRFGSMRSRRGGGRSRAGADVDPVLAAALVVVLLGGGGLAAYGATQDTAPVAAPAPMAQDDDPQVARAQAVVSRSDGGSATGEPATTAAVERRSSRADRASQKGRSVDPFAAGSSASASGAAATSGSGGSAASGSSSSSAARGSSSGSSGTLSATELARRAGAAASAAGAAGAGESGSSAPTTPTTPSSPATPTTPTTPAVSAADRAEARRRALAKRPARVSLRIVTATRRSARSRRALGLLVPNATESVARVISVSASNEVVTLRLRTGAALDGRQSKGTRCIRRLESGQCRLVRVRTGRTAVIRAGAPADGTPAAVTALRVLSVWRGGVKVAD